MDTKELYQKFIESEGISTDTRNIIVNSMFFALKGANFNGNLFAEKALDSGASYAVVDDKDVVVKDKNFVLVEDVLKSLQQLAFYHRNQIGIPILGITGTNGKTTTKELIKVVLEKKYNVYATQGNLNNHIGVPLTLLAIDKSVEVGIVEMGANHPGEIEVLCSISDPDYGLITNVGKAHLEGFGSFEGVMKTKAELYRHIEKKAGRIFINAENTFLKSMLKGGSTNIKYGIGDQSSVYAIEVLDAEFLEFKAIINNEEIKVTTNLVGEYNLENVLAAISIGLNFKVNLQDIVDAIGSYLPTNNRSQLVKTDNNTVLFDAYNANPTSMKAALSNLFVINKKNKVAVLGEMKELGKSCSQEHEDLLNILVRNRNINVILVGSNYSSFKDQFKDFIYFDDVDCLIKHIESDPIKNSYILVKGSRSNKLEKLKGIL